MIYLSRIPVKTFSIPVTITYEVYLGWPGWIGPEFKVIDHCQNDWRGQGKKRWWAGKRGNEGVEQDGVRKRVKRWRGERKRVGERWRGQGETMSHRPRELGSSSLYFPTGCIQRLCIAMQLHMGGGRGRGCTFTTAERIPPPHRRAHSTILLLVPLNVLAQLGHG